MDVIKRKRTDHQRQYDEEAFNKAVTAVKSGRLTSGKASILYGVPKSTVWVHVQKWKKLGVQPEMERLGASFRLTAEEENSLAQYLRWCEGVFIPFTYELLKELGFEILAKRGGSKKLSSTWAYRFAQRHNLPTRKPRHFPRIREQAYSDPDYVVHYFKLLEQLMEELDLLSIPHCVWNVDEKGWSKALQRPVIRTKGKQHQAERQIFTNEPITTVHCISASGTVIPPYIILNKRLISEIVVADLPHAWNFGSSESGFLNKELFLIWFKTTFLPNIGRERPQLLIYDAASSHISLEMVQLAMEENISIITLSGKSTALLQPVDQILDNLMTTFADLAFNLCFMKDDFLVRPEKFAPVLKQALKKSWTKALIQHAFQKTGVYPPSLLEVSKSPQLTKECREKLRALCGQEDDSSSPERVEPEATSNSDSESTDTDELQDEFCVCGRLIDDPCLDCIHRYKEHHNPLCRAGIITEGPSDLLDATDKNNPGQSHLSTAKHITGGGTPPRVPDDLHIMMVDEIVTPTKVKGIGPGLDLFEAECILSEQATTGDETSDPPKKTDAIISNIEEYFKPRKVRRRASYPNDRTVEIEKAKAQTDEERQAHLQIQRLIMKKMQQEIEMKDKMFEVDLALKEADLKQKTLEISLLQHDFELKQMPLLYDINAMETDTN